MKHNNNNFGLIGYPLSHSFSKGYFTKKFAEAGLTNYQYDNYAIPSITDFTNLIQQDANLRGLNVTIPYKEQVIPFLDELDAEAEAIGAVNTIKIKNGITKGYNTDVYGFEQALLRLLGDAYKISETTDIQALVLGTGGAAKAVIFVLNKLNIPFQMVSRSTVKGDLVYTQIDKQLLGKYRLLINTTPLGMSPNINTAPTLPYDALTPRHFLYDLIYNPAQTLFLQHGENRKATVANGLEMLHLQAERAWAIWNE